MGVEQPARGSRVLQLALAAVISASVTAAAVLWLSGAEMRELRVPHTLLRRAAPSPAGGEASAVPKGCQGGTAAPCPAAAPCAVCPPVPTPCPAAARCAVCPPAPTPCPACPAPSAAHSSAAAIPAELGAQERAALQRVLSWSYTLPPDALERGFVMRGDQSRLRRVARRLLQGEPIGVFTAGGSVTVGMGANLATEGWPFPTRIFDYMNRTFPPTAGRGHRTTNGGVSAMNSAMYEMCASELLDPDADLYILEFSVNDHTQQEACNDSPHHMWDYPQRRAFERLVRRTLAFKQQPAVLVLHHYSYHHSQGAYFAGAENDLSVVAEYYQVPTLSLRAATWPLMATDAPGFRADFPVRCFDAKEQAKNEFCKKRIQLTAKAGVNWKLLNPRHQMYADRTHPFNSTGHLYLAELVMYAVHQAALDAASDLAAKRASPAPDTRPPRLPKPMLTGNEFRANTQCFSQVHDSLKRIAVVSKGWEWVDGGKNMTGGHKWGWESDKPGSKLTLRLASHVGDIPTTNVDLMLGLLHSWQGMGQVQVACTSGCRCPSKVIDCHWEARSTQPDLSAMPIGQAPQCQVTFTVLGTTSSSDGGHRIKLSAVMVSKLNGDWIPAANLGVQAAIG